MTDIETRLTAAFKELSELIPDEPPSSFQDVRAWREFGPTTNAERDFWRSPGSRWRWRQPHSLAAIIAAAIVTLGGIGTGIAAPAGAFSPSSGVQHEFNQLAHNALHAPTISSAASPARLPSASTEHFLVTDPGSEGTTISVWASSPTPGVNCFRCRGQRGWHAHLP
jgi:hypothetical protein